MAELAIHGGTPVRSEPLPTSMIGAALIGEEELAQLADVVREKSPFRHYGIGTPTKVAQVETQMRNVFGSKYALAVSSGSAALSCAFAAAGLGPDDEVIIPSFTWYSDYCALVTTGITPMFAEIGPDLCMDPADFERKINSRTKAVVVVHYQGCPAEIEEIVEIARRHNIIVIEDCAQSFGAEYHGKLVGTFGDIAIFSFQTHKLITCGEGGLVLTDNEELFVRAVRYHDLGFVRPHFAALLEHPELAGAETSFAGDQYRMSELSGAFLLGQMGKLDHILKTCRAWHRMLCCRYASNPHFSIRNKEGDSGINFVLQLPTPELAQKFKDWVSAEGINCDPTSGSNNLLTQYPVKSKAMIHPDLPPFGPGCHGEGIVYTPENYCPNTESILARTVVIGIGPAFTEQDILDIMAAIDKVDAVLFQ